MKDNLVKIPTSALQDELNLVKIPTSALQDELNKRNDKSLQLETKYGKTLKELKKEYKRLEKGEKLTVFLAGVKVYCSVSLYDDAPEINVGNIVLANPTAENYIIYQALKNSYLYDESYELERIAQVNKAMEKMDDEFEKIIETCNKIGKELKMSGGDIFEDYIVCYKVYVSKRLRKISES